MIDLFEVLERMFILMKSFMLSQDVNNFIFGKKKGCYYENNINYQVAEKHVARKTNTTFILKDKQAKRPL